jgi:hypothetical protein
MGLQSLRRFATVWQQYLPISFYYLGYLRCQLLMVYGPPGWRMGSKEQVYPGVHNKVTPLISLSLRNR